MERYLVKTNTPDPPFFSPYFDAENHFNPDVDMVVFDLMLGKFTDDGNTWLNIETDHL